MHAKSSRIISKPSIIAILPYIIYYNAILPPLLYEKAQIKANIDISKVRFDYIYLTIPLTTLFVALINNF